jgi:NADH:ubiquinone oxidoreductase subunit 4 (subunit M)
MVSEFSFTLGLILLPLALGVSTRILGIPHVGVQFLALACIGVETGALVYLGTTFEPDPIRLQLAAAILLTGLCATLGQGKFKMSSTVLGSTLIVLGLSLGALLAPTPIHRIFLISLFGYAAFTVIKFEHPATPKTISLLHLSLVILIILASFVLGNTHNLWIGLFLAVTLLPLIPFHFPFLSIIGSAEGMLSGFWVMVLISLGLSEIYDLQHSMLLKEIFVIPFLALVSALYASLKCLVESRFRQFIAYAAVAQMALLWAIQQVFLDFSTWGIQFGIAVAFVMSGILFVYTFLQQRYGSHELGKFPGLASSMPRLGILMILLITLAMLLPILPILSGIMAMPPLEQTDVVLPTILLAFSGVWLLGSWYFTHLLHQTVFGRPHSDIPYTDLRVFEMGAVVLLIVGASYSGFVL